MQIGQKKNETQEKRSNSLAKMMMQRDKAKIGQLQKADYIELLKAPRGQKYLELLAKTTELCDQLVDIEAAIEKLEQEVEQENALLPASDAEATTQSEAATPPAKKMWWEDDASTATTEEAKLEQQKVTWTQSTPTWTKASPDTAGRMQALKEKQQRIQEMKQRRDDLVEEFKAAQKEFEAQLPVPEKVIGMIYPGWNEKILLKYGIIACPGTAYRTPQELLEQVQPRSEQEERQWLKGDTVYREYFCEKLLLVEIYMEAVCVVYKDGKTVVIEN